MNWIKRAMSLLLAIAMVLCLVPSAVMAQETEPTETTEATEPTEETEGTQSRAALGGSCGENASWSFEEATGTLTISGTGDMAGFDYEAAPWNSVLQQVRTVRVEAGITSIGKNAFREAANLTQVTLAEGITSIGNLAFYGCAALQSLTLPQSLRSFGEYTFGALGVTEFVIPQGVATIPANAFYGCAAMTSVTIPVSVTVIGSGAFTSCTALTDIYYGGSEEGWNGIVIYGSSNILKNATYHYGVQAPQEPEETEPEETYWSFDEATGKLTLTGNCDFESYTQTPWEEFQSEILELEVKEGVTQLPGGAFSGCPNLGKITIAASCTGFGTGVFHISSPITTAGPLGSGCDYEYGWTEHIPAFAFENLTKLEQVHLHRDLRSVSSNAFNGCSGITDVYYPGSSSQWNQVSVNQWHNGYFINARLHFGEDDRIISVRYYLRYDEASGAACFAGDYANCFVTDATDEGFTADPEALTGSYVLVSCWEDADGLQTLSYMKGLTSIWGILEAQEQGSVTVSGESYPLTDGVSLPQTAVGSYVLVHLLEGRCVAAEELRQGSGALRSWDPRTQILEVTASRTSETVFTFAQSPLAGNPAGELLGEEFSQYGRMVSWIADNADLLYDIGYVGFSPFRDGWCFANNGLFFEYYSLLTGKGDNFRFSEERYAEVFGAGYVATAQYADGAIFESMMKKWVGNCLGMSIMAALIYDGQLDLDDYTGADSFPSVNRYYSKFVKFTNSEFETTSLAVTSRYSEVTKMIERYQILYDGGVNAYMSGSTEAELEENYMVPAEGTDPNAAHQRYDHNPNGNYVKMVFDRIRSSEAPFILCMVGGDESRTDPSKQQFGHAVMTRTDIAPLDLGDGWYRVYVYDPNQPWMPQDYADTQERPLISFYCNDDPNAAYVDMNIRTNTWRYTGCATAGQTNKYMGSGPDGTVEYLYFEGDTSLDGEKLSWYRPDYMYIYAPEEAGYPLSFDGTASWRTRWDDYTVLRFTSVAEVIAYAREKDAENFIGPVAAVSNGIAWELAEGVEASQPLGMTADGEHSGGGMVTIPYGDLRLEVAGGSDISLIGNSFAFNIITEGNAQLDVSVAEGAVTVSGTDGGEVVMQLTHLYSNAEYTSVVAMGELAAGDTVRLSLEGNAFAGSLTGEGSLELLTDNHLAPQSRPLATLEEGSGKLEVADVTAAPVALQKVILDAEAFAQIDTVYAEGLPYAVEREGEQAYAMVPEGTTWLVTYTWHIGDETDVHTHYPTGMQVWQVTQGEGEPGVTSVPELENLLTYSGSSIRITGNKGIRMITSLTRENKAALTGSGLAGFTLEEYGTALCWQTDLPENGELVLGRSYTRSNYAYKKDVADPVFASTDTSIQYTNVLVGFTDEQCVPDIVMRPYIILKDAEGNLVTLYGGAVRRSIGYIAWQNRSVFAPGSASYDYVWDIIHHVYGDRFDEDYQQ